MRKILSMLLTAALLVTMVPTAWTGKAQAASGTYFIFPSEKYDATDARVVTTDRVDLLGSFNNVDQDTISYSVYQLSKKGSTYTEVSSNLGQTGNIYPTGTELKILNVNLFSGLNKIVISGKKGSASVSDTIYIEYRNGPTLSNLSATLNGATVALPEDKPAVLMASGTNKAASSTQIVVAGTAVNADKVTISANGKTWTFNVSSSSGYKFTAGTVMVNKGNNTLTITASNRDQSVTTTRQVTFYNGEPTFYNTHVQQGTLTSADLSTTPDFSVPNTSNIVMQGTAVVPFVDKAPASVTVNYALSGGAAGNGAVAVEAAKYSETASNFVTVPFEIAIPASAVFDSKIRLNLGIDGASGDSNLYFTLRNSTKPFIYDVNYLQGYNSNTSNADSLTLTGSSMLNTTTSINAVPAGIEVQVINAQAGTTLISGDPNVTMSIVNSESVNHTINGVPTNVKRFIVKVSSLPSTTKQILLKLKNDAEELETKTLAINMLYGPYVQFDSLYDGQQIKIDSNNAAQATKIKLDSVSNFSGQLFNVASEADIDYDGDNRTVFLYVNNGLIDLVQNGSKAKFTVADAVKDKAANAMILGANTIRFVYKSKSDSYEKTMKINITTTNVPLVPIDARGIVPFTYKSGDGGTPDYKNIAPVKPDPNFTGSNGDYTTTAPKMNVFGTFDFIDLGTNENNVDTELKAVTNPENYILKIESSNTKFNGGAPLKWTLQNRLHSDGSPQKNYNGSGSQVPNLVVYYHPQEQNFSFVLFNQDIPQDGSAVVYNFTLYNAGEGGPSSTYRLQVKFSTSSYKIVRPLPDRNLINQNFVEVVVSAPDANGVKINKQPAEKVDFDVNYDGVVDYPSAYKYVVTGLKPNKDNKIPIEVTVGKQVLKDNVTVKYVPTNIPGAEYMETMKKSHKVFEGALQLTFPTNTNLIRYDYYVPERLKNQVFSNNDLLFAIANREDGVVDRYAYLDNSQLAQINKVFDAGAQYFAGEFPAKFEKSSPVFWIDPGVADDLKTDAYDPIKQGLDPYQLSPTATVKNFYARDTQNELVPSKRGQLTLAYDPSVAKDAGKLITVLYFNPETKKWENIGGVVDDKKNTITVPFDRFGYYVAAKLGETYTDIISHPYARDYIEAMFAKGIMNPADPAVGFKPDMNITRAEFTEMIVKAQQLPFNYQGGLSFNDVSRSFTNNVWDHRFIETAARAGIVKGSQPGVFDPESSITRQDAAVIIAKALNLKLQTNRTAIDKGLSKFFKDYATIDYYAAPAVLAVAQKGFITGAPVNPKDKTKGNNFNPKSFTLRGDAAIIVAKVMASTKKLPTM